MYVTPNQKKKVILIAVIALLGIPLSVISALGVTQLLSKAAEDAIPHDIVVSNLTATSVTLSWTTSVNADASVTYKPNPGDGQVSTGSSQTATDARGTGTRMTHYVEISGLEPGTEYSFEIVSNGDTYTNSSGKSFTFTTVELSDSAAVPNPVYANIEGVNTDDAIVYMIVEDSYPLSASVRNGGNWSIDVNYIFSTATQSMIDISNDSEIILLARDGNGQTMNVTGKYSDLFDGNGRLKTGQTLKMESGKSIMTSFPQKSVISSVIAQITTTVAPTTVSPTTAVPTTVAPTTSAPTTVAPTTSIPTTVAPTTVAPTIFVRKFRVASDVAWGSIVLGESTTNKPDVKTGKDSVVITNLTDTGFSVVWVSDEQENGSVLYGTSAASLTSEAMDNRDSVLSKGKYYSHQVDVTKLTPETTYYFKIKSGADTIQNGTSPYDITTFKTLSSPPPYKTVTGKVDNYSGLTDGVVIVQVKNNDESGTTGDSTKVSTVTDSTGNWIASVGDSRKTDGSEYFSFSDTDKLTAQFIGYAKSDAVTVTADNLDDKVVTLTVIKTSTTSQKVSPLTDYGIYTTADSALAALGLISGGNNATTTPVGGIGGGVTTPSTGIIDFAGVILLVTLGLALLVMRINKGRKPKYKRKMLDKF